MISLLMIISPTKTVKIVDTYQLARNLTTNINILI